MRHCFIYLNRGLDTNWMEWYHTVKARVYLWGSLPKILRSLNKFHEIQAGGWPRGILHVVKERTIRKWELNTCGNFVNLRTEDFFVDRCRSKIYKL